VSFAAITLCVAFQHVFNAVVVGYFVIDSVRRLLDILSYDLDVVAVLVKEVRWFEVVSRLGDYYIFTVEVGISVSS
jgi:hypothetical protein